LLDTPNKIQKFDALMVHERNKQKMKLTLEMSLVDLALNQKGIVKHVNAGFRATQRLSGMGITPGTEIEVISQAPFRGPIQITVRGTRLAIGQGLAKKILIKKD
jgi:ferrous iron transport protein A